MQAVLSTLISAAVLMHSILGCCWHHAHDECGADDEIGTVLLGCLPLGCAEHAGTGSAGQASLISESESGETDHSGHHWPECRGACTYLVPGKTGGSSFRFAACDGPVLWIADVPCSSMAVAVSSSRCESARSIQPPVRLHLFYQHLLI